MIIATQQKRRDWFRILRDLMAKGVSMAMVAKACGRRATATVSHWAEGGEPKDTDARIVLALYAKHCPEQFQALGLQIGPDREVEQRSDEELRALIIKREAVAGRFANGA